MPPPPSEAGACAYRYRLEWRHQFTTADGLTLHVYRSRDVVGAAEMKVVAALHAGEAVGAEFMVSCGVAEAFEPALCLRAEEIAAWAPIDGALPRSLFESSWLADEAAQAHGLRLFVLIDSAFAEARDLRLVGRRLSRGIMRQVRDALVRR